MKKLLLILIIAMAFYGCATFNHSESIDVDHFGATGKYTDNRSGALYEMCLAGGGGGGGKHAGGGLLALYVKSNQSQSDPRNFAKSIVMVDMSKKLKSVKIDDVEGIREYEYVQPLARSEAKPAKPKSGLPPSFGYQPVE